MIENIGTVQTQSMQLWLKTPLTELGWPLASPVMDGYADDMNTWADMSHLIPREAFPPEHEVKNIAYYCGPLRGEIGEQIDAGFPTMKYVDVYSNSQNWLENHSGFLWPSAVLSEKRTALDWNHLVDPSGAQGAARLQSQYFRANVDPSERYVLSLKGSTQYRLRAGESGFSNLFLAGDWTQNDFNAGCVEATVMSGMYCANAMTGYPPIEDIVGHDHA